MKKVSVLILSVMLFCQPSYAEDYDPQHTMLALNMAIVSVNRILTTKSKAVLEEEYTNIINNLSLGNIESDKDMTALYRDLLGIISSKRISEEDSKRLKSYYDAAEQRRITYALSNIYMTETRIKSAQNEVNYASSDAEKAKSKRNDVVYSWLGNMAISCVSFFSGNVFAVGGMVFDSAEAYSDYQRQDAKLERAERERRRAESQLEQERVRLSGLRDEMKADEAMLKEELKASMWQLERQDMEECNALQQRLLQSSWSLLRQYRLPDAYRLTQNSLQNFYRAVQEEDISRRSRMLRTLEDEFRVYPPYWYFRAKTAQEAGNLSDARKFFAKFNEVWRPVLRRDPYKLEAAKFRVQDIAAEGKPLEEVKDEILGQLEIIYENTSKNDWANNLFLGVAYFLLGDKSRGMDCIAVNLDFGYESKVSGMLFAQMEKGALDSKEAQEEAYQLGEKYFWGTGVAKDYKEAVYYYLLAANAGHAKAQLSLGACYRYGYGVNKDLQKAREWLSKAAAQGHQNARDVLDDMNRELEQTSAPKTLTPQDAEEAFQLGYKYYRIGGLENDKKAVEYFLKAANAGHAEAQYRLGLCYRYGWGVNKDLQKAREWYGKAVVQAYPPARDALASMNRNGE